jgi:ABC-type branched-subunit amino acid transport system ATPase component
MPEGAMLQVRAVATFYGAIQALHGVDLDVAEGEIVTLIGANGAGKSTLLMTICGSPRARSGTIRLEGQDITRLPTHEIVLRGVAQVPEGRRIFPRMSVYENLQMGASPIRCISRKTSTGCSRCSPGWPSGASSAAAPCRAASSRCWRSAAP